MKTQSGALRVLRVDNYRLTWPALISSQLGRMMWVFASSILIYTLTDSALLTQMVNVTVAAPQFLLGIFSGTIADAYNRRGVMFLSLILMALFTFAGAFLALFGLIEAWSILALSTVIGILYTVNQVTRRTFTFDVVGKDLLVHAMALDNMGTTLGFILAPLLASLFLSVAPDDVTRGVTWTYFAIATFYAASGLLFFKVKQAWVQVRTPVRPSSAIANMSEGIKVVASSRVLIGIMGVTWISNFFFSPHRTMVPVIGISVLHVGPGLLGLLGAAQGAGSLIGALYLSSRGTIRSQSFYYWFGATSSMALLAVFAASSNFPLSFIGLVSAGIGQAWFGAMQATLVLTAAPEHLRGRIMGILNMAIGSQALGSLLLGIMSEWMGPGPALLSFALFGAISTVVWVCIYKEMTKL